MIIDVHTHIFPKDICARRENYFDGEAPFQLLYDSPKSRLITAEDLVRSMDENGVDKSVTFGFPWKKDSFYQKNNDEIIESVNKFPDRLIGLCCVDMYSPGASKEVERCLNAGLSGVGELAFYQSGIEPDALKLLEPVMALCRERNLPVMIHTNEPVGHQYPGKTPNTLSQIYELAKTFPDNIIILAHWGGGIFFYTLLKKEVKDVLKNIYYDTAASPFLYTPEIYQAAKKMAGIEKILMGTDYPLLPPERYFRELEAAGMSSSEKEQICGGNAAQVFGLIKKI
ncbi:MAG: amidohydrolase family protein [Desulfobacteraceae bacterium]|jgi:predicted TIM-barrel fold metal-dependent hydrolase|nr:amidohydrolase family protein [Desulfobacteraceae bacterium]